MRKVAERLKVGTMSLYTYVPGKPELLDLMLDAAIEASAPYDADAPWRARLEKVARENWDRFHRHPWLLEVTPLRPVLGPNTIARYDHELTALDGIGLTDVEMDSALTLLNAHTESAARRALEAAQAEQRSGITDEQWWAARAPVLERVIEPGRFPGRESRRNCRRRSTQRGIRTRARVRVRLRASARRRRIPHHKVGLPTAEFECSRNFYRSSLDLFPLI